MKRFNQLVLLAVTMLKTHTNDWNQTGKRRQTAVLKWINAFSIHGSQTSMRHHADGSEWA